MDLQQLATQAAAPVAAASSRLDAAVTKVGDLVKLEVVLTVLCAAIPLILLAVEGWPPTEAISGYHDMPDPEFFYRPLTTAALLFVMGGVRRSQWYNVALGLALAGLTFFNTTDYHTVHVFFTVAFFLGTPIVFVVFSPKEELWFTWTLALAMAAAIVSWFVFYVVRPHPYDARYFLDRREDARRRARLTESASLSRADWEVVFERLDVDGGAIAGERS